MEYLLIKTSSKKEMDAILDELSESEFNGALDFPFSTYRSEDPDLISAFVEEDKLKKTPQF
jgi:hypothetical protein